MENFLFIILIAATAAIMYFIMKSKSAAVEKEKAIAENSLLQAKEQLKAVTDQLEAERALHSAAKSSLAEAKANINNLTVKMQEQEILLRKEFENLANRILEEKSKKFTEQNRENLDIILNPFKEKIKEFEHKVETAYKTESAERNTLKGEIRTLMELNKKISEDANNLAVALKGDTKQQGNWGELVLERILEVSGLIKKQEYEMQVASSNSDGEKIILDAVVLLPENKHIIIDSKVSLNAYQSLIGAAGKEEREKFSNAHVLSVKNHIKNLAGKNYQTANGFITPDFVLMFMPIESSFGMAVQADNELFNFAWDRKVVIVSPSTLLATLRTISSIWKQERQTRNALQIAEEGGKLYDKLVGFVEDLIKVGRKMDEAKGEYTDAMRKLTDGPGNVIKKAENMKELGAKATKSLPRQIIERSE